jgi:hypothetical protein
LIREQEDCGGGDLGWRGHARGEWDVAGDGFLFFVGMREGCEPCFVGGGPDLGGHDGVDANAVGCEFDRPFPRERELRALGRRISGGAPLAGGCDLRRCVDDGAARLLERWNSSARDFAAARS